MADFSKVFPYLVPADWPARPYCLCRELHADSSLSVAYGQLEDDQIKYMMAKHALEEGYTVEDVDESALPNLRNREDCPGWKSEDVDWDGGTRPLYSRYGFELMSSDLLNPECLRQVQSLLECEEIKVAVPTSGSILAVAPDMTWGLAGFAKIRYDEAVQEGGAALTPYLFTVADGEIKDADSTEWDPNGRPY